MLINCVAYQEGKKLKDISIEEISYYLTIPSCFVWVAVQDAKLSCQCQKLFINRYVFLENLSKLKYKYLTDRNGSATNASISG